MGRSREGTRFLVCGYSVDMNKFGGRKNKIIFLFDSFICNDFTPVSLPIFVKPFIHSANEWSIKFKGWGLLGGI